MKPKGQTRTLSRQDSALFATGVLIEKKREEKMNRSYTEEKKKKIKQKKIKKKHDNHSKC